MKETKVLIVDDDEDILEALSMILENFYDFEINTAVKAENIEKVIEEFKPDVILLDMLLAGKDGRVICRALKNSPETQGIVVIMMSAHPSAVKGSIECGANDFIAKPFDIDALVDKIYSFS